MTTAVRSNATDRPHPPLPPDLSGMVDEVRPDDEVAVQRVEGWFREYAERRDPAIRERIILAYMGLSDRLAERYRGNRASSLEDLRQVARLGLVKAVDRYEPERANPFIPYAVATVIGEIKRYLRDTSWRLRVPRGTKDLALRLCRAIDELPQQLGHSPTVAELAEHLGASEDEVLEAIEVAQTRSAPSLDQPAGEEGDAVLGDFVMDTSAREETENLLILPELVGRLPERERHIVVLRYVDELTQDQMDEGPCVDAFEQGEPVAAADVANDPRWPSFGPLAGQHDVHALLGVPVQLEGAVGTLNVYASKRHDWDDDEVEAIQAYARIIASVLRSSIEAHLQGKVTEQLRYALDRRVVIEQAKGILMEREGLAPGAAFERIRRRARSHRERVIDVSRRLVDGEPLDPPAS